MEVTNQGSFKIDVRETTNKTSLIITVMMKYTIITKTKIIIISQETKEYKNKDIIIITIIIIIIIKEDILEVEDTIGVVAELVVIYFITRMN